MKKIATYVVLALASLLTLAPVIWTVLSSMRPPSESLSTDGSFIPSSLDLSSYPAVFEEVDMWLLILNSVLVTGIIAVGQMVSAAMASFVFARCEDLDFLVTTDDAPAELLAALSIAGVAVEVVGKGGEG